MKTESQVLMGSRDRTESPDYQDLGVSPEKMENLVKRDRMDLLVFRGFADLLENLGQLRTWTSHYFKSLLRMLDVNSCRILASKTF